MITSKFRREILIVQEEPHLLSRLLCSKFYLIHQYAFNERSFYDTNFAPFITITHVFEIKGNIWGKSALFLFLSLFRFPFSYS